MQSQPPSPKASAPEPTNEHLIEVGEAYVKGVADGMVVAARICEARKVECGMDPESASARQNGFYMECSYAIREQIKVVAAKATEHAS